MRCPRTQQTKKKTLLQRSQPFFVLLCRIIRKKNLSCSACDHQLQDLTHLNYPASEPLRRAIFGTYSSIFDLRYRPWGIAWLLILCGFHCAPIRRKRSGSTTTPSNVPVFLQTNDFMLNVKQKRCENQLIQSFGLTRQRNRTQSTYYETNDSITLPRHTHYKILESKAMTPPYLLTRKKNKKTGWFLNRSICYKTCT